VATTAEALRAYEGTYAAPDGMRVRVTAEGTALWVTLPDGERREVVLVGDDRVESLGGGGGRFVRDGGGRVTAVMLGENRLERVP
jgi:hypothetical protein